VKLCHGVLLGALSACALSLGARALPVRALAPPPPGVNVEAILGTDRPDGASAKYPGTLGEFGFFRDSSGREPAASLIAYDLNTPLYSDGAEKLRYLYVPEGETIGTDGAGLLQLPVGAAIIKTFAFGEGANQRFIETRVLLHRADGWLALPYLWNEEQTEARLALVGARVPIARADGSEFSYQVPNKNQCKQCHVKDGAVTPLGPTSRNLAHEWLATMKEQGKITDMPEVMDAMPVWGDTAAGTRRLARAYLDVNCAHCHQPGGSASNSGLDLRWEQDDPHAIGIGKPPVAAGRGSGGHTVAIAPGDPDGSILVHRMSSTEPGVAMPELGRATNDAGGIAVVRQWIAQMESTR
jgi:uncharacterized repeat protein (TIGR03806 family)